MLVGVRSRASAREVSGVGGVRSRASVGFGPGRRRQGIDGGGVGLARSRRSSSDGMRPVGRIAPDQLGLNLPDRM